MISWWWIIITAVCTAIIIGILTFILTQRYIQKQLEKNPPISKQQIRTMYAQMGRKPSEKQINQIMNSMKRKK